MKKPAFVEMNGKRMPRRGEKKKKITNPINLYYQFRRKDVQIKKKYVHIYMKYHQNGTCIILWR